MQRKLVFLLLFFTGVQLYGQLRPGSANLVSLTNAKTYGRTDSIFVFNVDNPDKYIYSVSPDSSSITFEWSRYDTVSKSFVAVKSATGDSSTLVLPATNAMYKIKRTGTGWSDSSTCWVLINDYTLAIQNCNWAPDTGWVIPNTVIQCGEIISIDVAMNPGNMIYFNPDSTTKIHFYVGAKNSNMVWSCSKTGPIEAAFNQLERDIKHPYWKDCYYIIKVTDDAGLVRKDSAFYKSIEPHAEFSYKYLPPGDSSANAYPNMPDPYYQIYSGYTNVSAPAKYMFTNKSESSTSYFWDFGDSVRSTADTFSKPHIYFHPGVYYPTLVAQRVVPGRYKACTDTFPAQTVDSLTITVEEPQYPKDINNVLDVNAVGPDAYKLRYFRFLDEISIGYFQIFIYNRYGKKVYQYEGDYRSWTGWDGTNKNTNNYVKTGVYFFVVKKIDPISNFDGTPQNIKVVKPKTGNDIYRGFIHVYNNSR